MELVSRNESKSSMSLQSDPNYLALSRMLARYQNLILLTPAPNEKLEARLAPWQKQIQVELWSPLPFHRMKWLRSIEGARTLLLKLEQSAQSIKVQRTKREAVKDLAEKRTTIKRLRSRIEEIGREVESVGNAPRGMPPQSEDDQSETMYDVLQQIRRRNGSTGDSTATAVEESEDHSAMDNDKQQNSSQEIAADTKRDQLFDSQSNVRRRQGNSKDEGNGPEGKTSGFSNMGETEQSLLASSREHENITTSLVSLAAQLKQQARQFQFTLDQDKGLIDRALEGLDQNVSAMGLASKGMKTLQRMSEEQGFWGRLKLQLLIGGMWLVAFLLVFAGPKLRF